MSDRFPKTLRTLTAVGRGDEDVCKRLGRQQGLFWRLCREDRMGKLNGRPRTRGQIVPTVSTTPWAVCEEKPPAHRPGAATSREPGPLGRSTPRTGPFTLQKGGPILLANDTPAAVRFSESLRCPAGFGGRSASPGTTCRLLVRLPGSSSRKSSGRCVCTSRVRPSRPVLPVAQRGRRPGWTAL